MISLTVMFYLFIFIFAIIGGMRGWAKELLVSFSVVLALFIIFMLMEFAPKYVKPFNALDAQYGYVYLSEEEEVEEVTPPDKLVAFDSLRDDDERSDFATQFWIRVFVVCVLVFFGYQTPSISRIAATARKDKIQDFLLGLVLGALNGYLIVGTLWSYMHSAHYPFAPFIVAPSDADPLLESAARLVKILPPIWLGVSPWVYAAVVLAFIFVLVVFI
ncbi:MAG: CvpA family protein [Chloroflexi bacterium]|nr:CvpA family protein [Chloroflexota bacterium]MBU1661075.1 CvpA family protein [Chloroflexota bacterium]